MTMPKLDRRGFLAGSGGLTMAMVFAPGFAGMAGASENGALASSMWAHVATDGTITIHAPAAEMGQGVQTIVPMMVAEELDADWDDVVVETAPVHPDFTHPVFQGQYTVASLTVKGYWIPARTAGAQLRRVLMQAAAEHWGVDVAELTTEPSAVVGPDGARLSYGEIAGFAEAPAEPPEIVPEELKPVSEFRILGNDAMRVDVPDKSTGRATYAADIRLDGMLYATVARAPVRGQIVGPFNQGDVSVMPGVMGVFDLGHGVAVVAQTMHELLAARAALEITWSGEPDGLAIDSERDREEYLARLNFERDSYDVVFSENGEPLAALEQAEQVRERFVVSEYCYHAQMEPMGAVAHVRDDGVEVWTGTQWQSMAQGRAAEIAGVDPEAVTIHQLYMGGGFGRRAHTEYIDDVVAIAREFDVPVKLLLSREDDVASGRLRPLVAQRVSMGLDSTGRITALNHAVACEPVSPYMYGQARWEADEGMDLITMRGASLPHYAVTHQRAEHFYEMRGARVAAWRGIGAGYTKFALEVMIDEIAREAGQDPLDYRLAMAGSDRLTDVLERVAGLSSWRNGAGEGRAKGLAFAEYGDSLAAVVAEISIDDGAITAHNLWAVADAGLALQPHNIRAQMEGGMLFGLSAALKEEVTIRDGVVQQSNFDDYPILRMDETPQIEIDIIEGSDMPYEVGELGLPAVAPAIANAVLAMTGRAPAHLPMTPERIRTLLDA